ncbi:MAG: Cache 3/Cache 2 fusion domain-containing protein [Comamonas sp.]|nr:Cache 3/Cache 2 fusion domain-containing protein [Candidatus Comamonas equi]
MLEKLQKIKLNLSAKLSLATLLSVAVIMAVLMLAISQRVTHTISERAEIDMQQSIDMIRGFLVSSDQELQARTKHHTAVFREENAKTAQLINMGARKMLLLNGGVANGDNAPLERFQSMTSAMSTVFVLDDGKFKSIASTVKLENGEAAVGTFIPTELSAHQDLIKGKENISIAELFGKQYMAHYTPLLDENQQIVGALFIGIEFSVFLESIKKTLRELKVGKTGYYFVMQAQGPQRAVITVHPRVEGDNLWERQDAQGGKYIQHMINTARGVHVYDVVNKDNSTRTMITAYDTFAPWNWLVAASVNESEILEANQSLHLIFIALGLGGVAVLTGVLYLLVRRTVIAPVAQGLQVMQALSKGDLTQRTAIDSDDEIGKLLTAINSTASSLDGLIRTVQHKANGVTLASSEIARGNADLASRTENSASALEETAAAMEELGATVRHNADNATTANTLSRQAQDVATSSGQAVRALVQTMAGIDHSSQRIADIIGVIDGIAFQTNILALNAAVEAARAGEHGRGFAVVASEVRALAGRSADAAKEIKALIQTSVTEVRAGNERASTAGSAMQQAVDEITKVTRVISEISHASLEQSNGVAQVGEAISSMDQATQKNAALVEEMAAAAQSLSAQANELLSAVAIFKLREESASTASTPALEY